MKTISGDLDSSQDISSLDLTEGETDSHGVTLDVSEGERLRRLLESTRYQQTQLAEAIGVTKEAVRQWTKMARFSDRIWEKLQSGLETLGLDPAEIRPEIAAPRQPIEDLTKLVELWPAGQLAVLKRVLDADPAARTVLLAYINGSLRKIP